MARITSLHEIETHWSINDLMDANEALDIKTEIEQFGLEKIKRTK